MILEKLYQIDFPSSPLVTQFLSLSYSLWLDNKKLVVVVLFNIVWILFTFLMTQDYGLIMESQWTISLSELNKLSVHPPVRFCVCMPIVSGWITAIRVNCGICIAFGRRKWSQKRNKMNTGRSLMNNFPAKLTQNNHIISTP